MFGELVFRLSRRLSGRLVEHPCTASGPMVYLHIPKSAGVSFNNSLSEALGSAAVIAGFDHSLFGAFDAFDTLGPEVSATVYGPDVPLPAGADFIGGHFALSTLRRNYPVGNYCSVVREPVCRLISHWLYWRQFSDDALAPWGPDWARLVNLARRPLLEFLQAPEIACQTDNLVTRMLLWPDQRIPAGGFIPTGADSWLLIDALKALRRLHFVDHLENPQFAANVGRWIGRPFVMQRANETRRAHDGFPVDLDHELTPEALALLEHRSRLDLVLWREVVASRQPSESPDALRRRAIASVLERHRAVQA
ncbi:hypothetical protein [Xanthobacter tagetidis]|nr:hypothetical protein [Xanthobacter tagetidis]MBB6309034.1 hypothetical protein [Xanthobacter tagetidis]